MAVLASGGFLWGALISDQINHHTAPIFYGVITFLVILIASLLYKMSLKPIEEELVPESGTSLKNIVQLVVESVYGMVKGAVPHNPERFTTLLIGLFIFIFSCNLMGLIPGFASPTSTLGGNLAIAFVVFFYYHVAGVREVGIKSYLSHFIGPSLGNTVPMLIFRFGFLVPILVVVEAFSHIARPVTLALRLFVNINGDHLVMGAFSSIIPYVVPVIFLAFGIFVSFIQAFVFTLLSTFYIAGAIEHAEDH